MIQTMCYGVYFLILCSFSVVDIKVRSVSAKGIRIWALLGVVLGVLIRVIGDDFSFVQAMGGIGLALGFFLLSRISEEAMGYGDDWGILGISTLVGLWNLIEVLSISFFLLAAAGGMILWKDGIWKGGKGRRRTLPFFPFLTAGFLFWVISQKGL